MHNSRPDLILASSSPRRKEILSRLKIPFRVVPPSFIECSDNAHTAKEEAFLFAKGKALSVASRFQDAIVIGSDTLIECDGKKIGKPHSPEDARGILRTLQGRSHVIWTGVFMMNTIDRKTQSSVAKVDVTLFQMSDTEIDAYIATGEPLDKAGAYAVQGEGRRFIRALKGDRLAAIGLPLRPVADFLASLHFPVSLPVLHSIQGTGDGDF